MADPRTALQGARSTGLIKIADRGPVGMVTLRGDLGDQKLGSALRDALGLVVPATWRASFGEDGTGAVWMAPDELLLLTHREGAPDLAAGLSRTLDGSHHLALDVSDARAVIALTGPGVAEVLAKGAPVDLSAAAFPRGAARRTHLGSIAVVFWRRDDETWEIACFRSFARHLFDWLATSARPGSAVDIF